jgi:hypothetical protein
MLASLSGHDPDATFFAVQAQIAHHPTAPIQPPYRLIDLWIRQHGCNSSMRRRAQHSQKGINEGEAAQK